jgi:hypothetical protein
MSRLDRRRSVVNMRVSRRRVVNMRLRCGMLKVRLRRLRGCLTVIILRWGAN